MFRIAAKFIRHFFLADSPRKINSGWGKAFVEHVYRGPKTVLGAKIESLRKEEAKSRELIEIEDFGAGYGGDAKPVIKKELRQVINSSARGRKEGELLYRICKHYQPQTCLELGTNLGFSTLYQLAGLNTSRFITIEGAPELAKRAQLHFDQFGFQPEVRVGEFSEQLTQLLADHTLTFDYIFIDGNHKYEAVTKYVNLLLPRLNKNGMLIVDDIRWSNGMEKAWKEISTKKAFSVTFDMFFMGVCLRGDEVKMGYLIRP